MPQGVFLGFYIDGKEPTQQVSDVVVVWINCLHGGKVMIVCFSVKSPLEEGATDIIDFLINAATSDNSLGDDVRIGQTEENGFHQYPAI